MREGLKDPVREGLKHSVRGVKTPPGSGGEGNEGVRMAISGVLRSEPQWVELLQGGQS